MRRKALSAIFVIMTEEDGEDFQAGGQCEEKMSGGLSRGRMSYTPNNYLISKCYCGANENTGMETRDGRKVTQENAVLENARMSTMKSQMHLLTCKWPMCVSAVSVYSSLLRLVFFR